MNPFAITRPDEYFLPEPANQQQMTDEREQYDLSQR